MPAIQKTDPTRWSQHVVRALGSRLPGGIASVTAPCEVCQSVFYPCLCSVEEPKRAHKGGLRAPRIVQVAEHERLSSEGRHPGHLDLVQQGNDDVSMDKTTLEFLEAGAKDDDGEDLPLGSARILYRHGRHYVIQTDGDKGEMQELKLTVADVQELKNRMDSHLMIDKEADHHHEEVNRGATKFDQREVTYEDETEVDEGEEKDLQLDLMQHGGISRYIVQKVNKDGKAAKAGICKGHELLQVWDGSHGSKDWAHVSEKRLPPVFLKGDGTNSPTGSQSPVSLARAASAPMGRTATRAGQAVKKGWPCRLVFSALPRGWKATGFYDAAQSKKALTMSELEGLAAGDPAQEVRLIFQYLPMRVITRGASHVRVRHQHMWEKEVEWDIKNDKELLMKWGVEVSLTPSQLEFTFRQVIKALAKEMQIFRAKKLAHSTLIAEKCRRCVDLEQKLKRQDLDEEQQKRLLEASMKKSTDDADQERPQPLSSAQKQLLEAMKEADLEMRRVLETIPRNHLEEIVSGEEPLPPDFVAGGGPVRHVQKAQQDQRTQRRIGTMAQEKIADFLKKERKRKKDRPHAEDDGRMTAQEFRLVLLNAGITWLSEEETDRMFQALDTEQSGYVNMGQVLKAATRALQMGEELRTKSSESAANGEFMSSKDLILQYTQDLGAPAKSTLSRESKEATMRPIAART